MHAGDVDLFGDDIRQYFHRGYLRAIYGIAQFFFGFFTASNNDDEDNVKARMVKYRDIDRLSLLHSCEAMFALELRRVTDADVRV